MLSELQFNVQPPQQSAAGNGKYDAIRSVLSSSLSNHSFFSPFIFTLCKLRFHYCRGNQFRSLLVSPSYERFVETFEFQYFYLSFNTRKRNVCCRRSFGIQTFKDFDQNNFQHERDFNQQILQKKVISSWRILWNY